MEIKRFIKVNDIAAIDYQNVGLHWTSNPNYKHDGGGSNGLSEGRYHVWFIIEDFDGAINEAATEISNEEHPHEKEVILAANQQLLCMVSIVDSIENYEVSFEEDIEINTGTRCDQWVKNI